MPGQLYDHGEFWSSADELSVNSLEDDLATLCGVSPEESAVMIEQWKAGKFGATANDDTELEARRTRLFAKLQEALKVDNCV